MPNEQWNDFALTQKFEGIDRFIEATAQLPVHMAKLTQTVEDNGKRIDSHHAWIEDIQERNETRYVEVRKTVTGEIAEVRALCERIGKDLRDDAKERVNANRESVRNRYYLMGSIVSAAAVVAAAILAAPK